MNYIKRLLKSLNLGFKSFLKYIPGFRSGEKINMIIAGVYYIVCLLFLIVGLIFFKGRDIRGAVSSLFLPYILFSFIDYMNSKM